MMRPPIWLVCALALTFAACKKNISPQEKLSEKSNEKSNRKSLSGGYSTPVGQPNGSVYTSQIIGKSGGTIMSPNGEITVTIPPGALPYDEYFTLRGITNNCPGSYKNGFRLLPEGITFAKPVTITILYEDLDSLYYQPEFLTIAYQDTNGVWMSLPQPVVDTVARSISIQTTHFSDWAPVTGLKVTASQPIISPNSKATVTISVIESLFGPVQPGERPLSQDVTIDPKYIQGWHLQGPGRLEAEGGQVTYFSPMTSDEPLIEVLIYATIKPRPGDHLTHVVGTTIYVGNGYFSYTINNGRKITVPIGPASRGHGPNLWSAVRPGINIVPAPFIAWPDGTGTHSFLNTPAEFNLLLLGDGYSQNYRKPTSPQIVRSPGNISVEHRDGYVKGTFRVDKSGKFSDPTQTAVIKGSFITPIEVP